MKWTRKRMMETTSSSVFMTRLLFVPSTVTLFACPSCLISVDAAGPSPPTPAIVV